MIRGKKNFIPQTALVFGFGILYKLEEESVPRHKNDRVVKVNEEERVGGAETPEALKEEDDEVEDVEDVNQSESDTESEVDNSKSLFPDTSLQIKLVSDIKYQI